MSKPLSSDLVGLTSDPMPVSWKQHDVQLYACAVGARPDAELDFLYEGRGPKVLPTFGVMRASAGMALLFTADVKINPAMVLHGQQSVVLHREIPGRGKATAIGRITEVWDKGKAAVIGAETTVEDDDGPLFTAGMTLFVRGGGGFGGERGPSTDGKNAPPERDPDVVVEHDTRPEQAALYRLCGDSNPIHIDPEFARKAGFEAPFLHGLCTYGVVGRAILHALCGGDPARFKSFDARFADQVQLGDTIVTKLWRVGDGEAIVQAESQRGNVVLSQSNATFAA